MPWAREVAALSRVLARLLDTPGACHEEIAAVRTALRLVCRLAAVTPPDGC